jgi:peptidyl-tRNA hydrolase, PTH2 family
MEPKQVIVMRKDLNMRKGKMCAQAAHASLAVLLEAFFGPYGERSWEIDIVGKKAYTKKVYLYEDDPITEWVNSSFKKIVVGAESLQECVDAYQAAKKAGIPCSLIEDKGLTEFGGNITITCCAIGPDDPEKIDKITGHLSLL